MKNANIGIANLVVSNKLRDSYFNNTLIEESKKLTTDFFEVVKSSPILQLEFKVFNNLENKTIENELLATRNIDSNIKLFEVYTIREIQKEHEKLQTYIDENQELDEDRIKLYEAISNLITESLNDTDKIDVDVIHESFEIVLNHVKTPKVQNLIETVETKDVNEQVIEIAIDKFNEKYDSLNEDDKNLLKKLIKANKTEKQELLETYRSDCLTILEGVGKDESDEKKNKIANAIRKLKEMKYNAKTINNDIIGLHEFKKELL